VKNRFQNVPFIFNLHRYIEGLTLQLKAIAGDGVDPRTFPWVGLCVDLHDAHWSALYTGTNDVAVFLSISSSSNRCSCLWGRPEPWLEPPPPEALEGAAWNLREHGAISAAETLTPLVGKCV
jgi:hypothetical protein